VENQERIRQITASMTPFLELLKQKKSKIGIRKYRKILSQSVVIYSKYAYYNVDAYERRVKEFCQKIENL
jgi:hypothetical protein